MASMIFENLIVSSASPDVTAGQATTTSSVVDLQDCDEAAWLIHMGDCTAAGTITVTIKENSANSTSSPTPTNVTLVTVSSTTSTAAVITSGALVVTAAASDCDDKIFIVGAGHQAFTKRYAFITVVTATQNAAINSIQCVRTRTRGLPVSQSSDVVAYAYAAA